MPPYLNSQAPLPRSYQSDIANSVLKKGSSLVVLPTGMGKTLLALLVAEKMLEKGNVLMLAPTKPLATQHEKTVREWMDLREDQILFISGQINAQKRVPLYKADARFIISTPQTIANDLEKGRLEWKGFSLVIFDEVHRAIGKYAYTKVAKVADENKTMVLGLTASPGGNKKKIQEILDALNIKNVEIRTSEDEDVKKYVKPLKIKWIEVHLTPEIRIIKKILEDMIKDRTQTLKKMGFRSRFATKKEMSELRAKILASNSSLKFSALSYHATLFSTQHMLELLETQGVQALKRFIKKVRERQESKAQKRLLNDKRFKILEERLQNCQEHPKLDKLITILREKPKDEKFIVFSQYRDQVEVIEQALNASGFCAKKFMGKKDGVTQKAQAKTIEEFREGKFNILVATSIGEEGLDIPSVDTVIFYEPVPSEIRQIQRRGRAGRAKLGNMIGLIAKGTRDEAFYWSAKKKEHKMQKIVSGLSGRIALVADWKKNDEEYQKVDEQKIERSEIRKKVKESAKKKKKEKKSSKAPSDNKKRGQTKMSDFF
jgi:ERCC4-related helicase